jgi:hypothetical protein
MYRREYPITPSQLAINGAFSIYVEGGKRNDTSQMLLGLSVLRHATEEQIRTAMPFVETSQGMTNAGIQEMLAR